jgi:hypothetical protein
MRSYNQDAITCKPSESVIAVLPKKQKLPFWMSSAPYADITLSMLYAGSIKDQKSLNESRGISQNTATSHSSTNRFKKRIVNQLKIEYFLR